MGKQPTRRRGNKQTVNPLKRVSAGIQQAMGEVEEDKVLPLIAKLNAPNAADRAWSASCISNLVMANESTRKLLLTNRIVVSLIERLTDDNQEVIEEVLGTLRNLASVEPTIVKEYYNRDILTPLAALLPRISHTLDLVLKNAPLEDDTDKERRQTIWDFAENFIYIIWTISETSDHYLKAINRLNLINFFISFLSAADQCPTRVVVAAGQCLTTLTEDNKDIYIEFQNHPEYINMLFDILNNSNSPDKVLVSVLACAILMNVKEVVQLSGSWDDDRDALGELNKKIIPILVASLDYDIQAAAEKSVAAVQSGNVTKHEETGEITPKPKQPLVEEERYIQSVEDRLSTLQLSLELLADICLQGEDSEEDGWADEDDEDMGDENLADNINEDNIDDYLQDAAALNDNTNGNTELLNSNPVMHAFTYQIFPQLIRLATPTPTLSFPADPTFCPTVTLGLSLTHQRSLECINNFLLAMNDVPSKIWFKEHVSDAQQAWQWLFQTAHQIGSCTASESRDSILEVMVGCLWSLGRGLGQNIPLGSTDVATLCGAYQSANRDSSMRVKVIGCLGPIAAKQGDIETNKMIGQFIMDILCDSNGNPEVKIEALNFLYDVYSDCEFDYDEPVFVHGGYLNQLKQLVPSIRSMVKSIDRRKQFDLRSRADEALTNLVAFIKYKTTERR
ncbi:armadillo-type protein [Halteromyces radiatus]|uniref:armadillo-type protein n=1 Tax=Halteromyces radiatus TaxID=101107 RepID=UPI00221F0B6B|nr:armadillo-type protein [Halteromyces radiatus]KAI8083106.1 armadillo-type protein [Halteromyces radiatus]